MECNLPEGKVYFKHIGDGRPLIFLHGRVGDHRYMEALFEPLFKNRPGWQRIYLDLPGCGKTQVDESVNSHDRELDVILACIDQILPDRRFSLAGLSYGGYLARGVVFRQAEQLDGLCLIAPRIKRNRHDINVPEIITLVTNDTLRDELAPGEVDVFESLVVQSRQGLERLREHFFPGRAMHDWEHNERVRASGPGLSFDVDDLNNPFTKPTLIVTGRQDSTVGYQDAWDIITKYPRATFAVLDKAGHFLGMAEQIELFGALIQAWLERVESETVT